MAIAKGTAKQVGYKKETTWGTIAGASGGKLLRRVTASFNLNKETYESNEIRTDRQVADFRHGVRSAAGTLNGELSPATYSDFMGSIVGKDFATAPSATTVSVTIAASGTLYTVTRAAGSYITDGFQVGMVVRLSVGTLNAANINKNLLIASMTATVLTVAVVNGSTMVAEGPIAGCTVTAVGKSTAGRFATLGNSGGADTVALNDTQMPVHSHTASSTQGNHTHGAGDYGHAHNTWNNYTVAAGGGAIMTGSDGDGRGNATATGYASIYINQASAGAITTTVGNAGGSGGVTQAHENMPPFVVVNYIIKT